MRKHFIFFVWMSASAIAFYVFQEKNASLDMQIKQKQQVIAKMKEREQKLYHAKNAPSSLLERVDGWKPCEFAVYREQLLKYLQKQGIQNIQIAPLSQLNQTLSRWPISYQIQYSEITFQMPKNQPLIDAIESVHAALPPLINIEEIRQAMKDDLCEVYLKISTVEGL